MYLKNILDPIKYIYDVDFKYNMLHSDCKFNNAFSKAISQIHVSTYTGIEYSLIH